MSSRPHNFPISEIFRFSVCNWWSKTGCKIRVPLSGGEQEPHLNASTILSSFRAPVQNPNFLSSAIYKRDWSAHFKYIQYSTYQCCGLWLIYFIRIWMRYAVKKTITRPTLASLVLQEIIYPFQQKKYKIIIFFFKS